MTTDTCRNDNNSNLSYFASHFFKIYTNSVANISGFLIISVADISEI